MFDTIAGLPLHPLVVHAVVVLLPLSSLGAVAMAVRPRWQRTYGWLVLTCAFLATGAALVAKASGEALASRLGLPVDHYAVARWLPYVAGVQLLCVAALWWRDRSFAGVGAVRRDRTGRFLAVVTVVVALVTLAWTVRAGDTGARIVWGKTVPSTTPGQFPVP